jgi:ankyrin repeat protein
MMARTSSRFRIVTVIFVTLVALVAVMTWRSANRTSLQNTLSEAVTRGDVDATRRVLAHGADPNEPVSAAGDQLSLWDRVRSIVGFRRAYEGQGEKSEPYLITAVESGNAALVRTLLEHGAEVNTSGHDGRTALMQAVFSDDPSIIQALLEHRASVNARDFYGNTALTLAESERKQQLMRLLTAAGGHK